MPAAANQDTAQKQPTNHASLDDVYHDISQNWLPSGELT